MRVLKILIALAIALYLLLLAVFFFTQRSLLYYPTRSYIPLADARANRAFIELAVTTNDGTNLKAWYAPAATKPLTIVFFHGNADCLFYAAPITEPYIAAGYGFLLAEYRGYSGLPGAPTEKGLYEDGRAYIRALIARGVPADHIVLFGHSLGTGVAVQMAEEFHVAGVMLLAPYLSVPKLARVHYPIFPSFLALDRFDNEARIAKIGAPLLIVNGAIDTIIPPAQGTQLFALAHDPKEFHSLPGRGHNDAFDDFVPISLEWMSRACREVY